MKRIVAVVIGLCASSPAWALDYWMWGVGPKIGTTFLPGRSPLKFPGTVADDAAISKVGGDFTFGFNATYYASSQTRLGVDFGADVGKGFLSGNALLQYDYVKQSSALDFLFGGEVGFGAMNWVGDQQANLRVNSFPFRAETGLVVRDQSRAYQGMLYFQWDVPSRQIYTQPDGTKLDGGVGFGLYAAAGLEITVMFGDFTPPKRGQPAG